jgi:hypothetical protein
MSYTKGIKRLNMIGCHIMTNEVSQSNGKI